MKLTKEIKTALLVLISLGLIIWGITFLSGTNLFSTSKKLYVKYPNVEGLSTASNITINGLVVGKVNKITLEPQGDLLVEMLITESIDIPKSSKATMYSPSFIGGKNISLQINYKDPTLTKTGDFLQGQATTGILDNLGEKADPVIQKLDSALYNINTLITNVNNTLDPASQKNLQEALAELNNTMKNANQITTKFDKIITTNQGKINNIVTDFNKTSTNLSKFSNELDNIQLQKLQEILNKFDQSATSLQAMLSDVERGKGNIGKLMKEEQLYQNLENASKELNQLLEDVKLNPKRYINISVFGKTAQPYVEPIKK